MEPSERAEGRAPDASHPVEHAAPTSWMSVQFPPTQRHVSLAVAKHPVPQWALPPNSTTPFAPSHAIWAFDRAEGDVVGCCSPQCPTFPSQPHVSASRAPPSLNPPNST